MLPACAPRTSFVETVHQKLQGASQLLLHTVRFCIEELNLRSFRVLLEKLSAENTLKWRSSTYFWQTYWCHLKIRLQTPMTRIRVEGDINRLMDGIRGV